MDCVLEKLQQQARHRFCNSNALHQREFVIENFVRYHACGEIGYAGNCGHLDADMPGSQHFRYCRHADRVGAKDTECTNFRRGLEVRAKRPEICTFIERHVPGFGAAPESIAQAGVVGLSHVKETGTKGWIIWSDQRIGAGPVDMVCHHHEATGCHVLPETSGGVGQDQRLDTKLGQRPYGQNDGGRRMAFIDMRPALQDEDVAARKLALDQASVMAFNSRLRKAGNIVERNRGRVFHCIGAMGPRPLPSTSAMRACRLGRAARMALAAML